MKPKIAILGANEPLRSFYQQTKALGYEIHSIAWPEGAVCKEYADFFYPISFSEKDKVLQQCKKIRIDGITSFSLESALPCVNYVSRNLGLPCNSSESELLTQNKFTMREQLKKSGINVPGFFIINEQDLQKKNKLPYPVIVKPIDSGGSRGVTLVRDNNEFKTAIQRALKFSFSKSVLVEEYIEGQELSVECISKEGMHYFVTVTDKVTTGQPYFVEIEHHQPAIFEYDVVKKIQDFTFKSLSALKIYSCASHTEIKINTKGELFIIEIGVRMGGDFITSDLVRLSTGYDFVEGVLKLSIDDFNPPRISKKMYSGIYFLSEETLRLKGIFDNPLLYPEIIKSQLLKNEIVSIKESNDRAAYFIYQSEKKFIV